MLSFNALNAQRALRTRAISEQGYRPWSAMVRALAGPREARAMTRGRHQ